MEEPVLWDVWVWRWLKKFRWALNIALRSTEE